MWGSHPLKNHGVLLSTRYLKLTTGCLTILPPPAPSPCYNREERNNIYPFSPNKANFDDEWRPHHSPPPSRGGV